MAEAKSYNARIQFPNGEEKMVGVTHINFNGTPEEAKAQYLKGHPKDQVLSIEEVAPPTDQEVAAIIDAGQRVEVPPQPAAVRNSLRQPGSPPAPSPSANP